MDSRLKDIDADRDGPDLELPEEPSAPMPAFPTAPLTYLGFMMLAEADNLPPGTIPGEDQWLRDYAWGFIRSRLKQNAG